MRLELAAAQKLAIFVGLEITGANDHRLRIERRGNSADAFTEAADEELPGIFGANPFGSSLHVFVSRRRDRIKALTQIQSSQGINPRGVAEADVIALHLEHGQACVQVFFIRAHQSWGNRDFYPRTGAGADEAEILEAFVAQFYDDKEPPRLILLSHGVENEDLLTELLSDRAGRKVEIAVPQRGEKAEHFVARQRHGDADALAHAA